MINEPVSIVLNNELKTKNIIIKPFLNLIENKLKELEEPQLSKIENFFDRSSVKC